MELVLRAFGRFVIGRMSFHRILDDCPSVYNFVRNQPTNAKSRAGQSAKTRWRRRWTDCRRSAAILLYWPEQTARSGRGRVSASEWWRRKNCSPERRSRCLPAAGPRTAGGRNTVGYSHPHRTRRQPPGGVFAWPSPPSFPLRSGHQVVSTPRYRPVC